MKGIGILTELLYIRNCDVFCGWCVLFFAKQWRSFV